MVFWLDFDIVSGDAWMEAEIFWEAILFFWLALGNEDKLRGQCQLKLFRDTCNTGICSWVF